MRLGGLDLLRRRLGGLALRLDRHCWRFAFHLRRRRSRLALDLIRR